MFKKHKQGKCWEPNVPKGVKPTSKLNQKYYFRSIKEKKMNENMSSNVYLPKVMVFIDAEYVIQSLKDTKNLEPTNLKNIDWSNLINWVSDGYHLIRTYYYTAKQSKTKGNRSYRSQIVYLRQLKEQIQYLEIKQGKLIQQGDSWVQKGVDVMLAVDLVMSAVNNHYDIAVVFAGDSDFTYALQSVKNLGKQVELFTFDRSDCSSCDDFILSADVHTMIDAEIIQQNNLVKE